MCVSCICLYESVCLISFSFSFPSSFIFYLLLSSSLFSPTGLRDFFSIIRFTHFLLPIDCLYVVCVFRFSLILIPHNMLVFLLFITQKLCVCMRASLSCLQSKPIIITCIFCFFSLSSRFSHSWSHTRSYSCNIHHNIDLQITYNRHRRTDRVDRK